MTVQLGLTGMPTRLFSCTPSRLTTWLDCPRRYRMTYLDRPAPPKGPPWAHNTVGSAVHLALSRWWSEPIDRRTPATARALVERAWSDDGFASPTQSARHREYAADMVARYVATLDPLDEPVGVERTVATRTGALAVSGRVDRVDRRGDELVVVDYKTGRSVLTVDDARGSLALALYALACERTLRRRCTAVELHHLPTGRVARFDHTEESLARHLSRAEAIGAEAVAAAQALRDGGDAEELFPARAGRLCGWCDFVRGCPAGLAAAGSPRSPWDGLAAEGG
ncbi:MAG: putative RecB family exonuclease [Actinomycetota bacterium]|jgi:RecB family exonuclease|nr:putative RecB family exonuclease [Actinomycetota bacterium]